MPERAPLKRKPVDPAKSEETAAFLLSGRRLRITGEQFTSIADTNIMGFKNGHRHACASFCSLPQVKLRQTKRLALFARDCQRHYRPSNCPRQSAQSSVVAPRCGDARVFVLSTAGRAMIGDVDA